jgi:hypothetical protein
VVISLDSLPPHVPAAFIAVEDPGATGGAFAAPVWGRIMRQLYEERPAPADWDRPASVVSRRIDPGTGMILGDGCHPRYGASSSELFVEGRLPPTVCPYRDYWQDLWDRRGVQWAPPGRPEVRGREPLGRPAPGRGRPPRRN